VQYGAPIWFSPGQASAEGRARNRRMVAYALHELEAEAARRVARRDLYPHPQYLAWLGKPAETLAPESDS
jgi:hypothetical protein